MTADFDRAGAALMQALRDIPDPPCDLRAARLELRRRTRRVTVRRRLALGAIVVAAALVALALVQGLPRRDNGLPPIKQLPSGLPIGTLTGRLHTQLHTPEGGVFPLFLRLVVRPDGTGTYDINDARGGSAYATWRVWYVGGGPGRVTLKRHSLVCGKDDKELSLEFTVGPKVVTITRAVTGECSPVTIVGVDLRGVVLRLSPSAPGDRTSVGDGSF
jgi:hypothetical protein